MILKNNLEIHLQDVMIVTCKFEGLGTRTLKFLPDSQGRWWYVIEMLLQEQVQGVTSYVQFGIH